MVVTLWDSYRTTASGPYYLKNIDTLIHSSYLKVKGTCQTRNSVCQSKCMIPLSLNDLCYLDCLGLACSTAF